MEKAIANDITSSNVHNHGEHSVASHDAATGDGHAHESESSDAHANHDHHEAHSESK